jgi:hypothetical protein
MLRRELIFLHSASGDGCNDRPLLLATPEDFYRPVCIGSKRTFASPRRVPPQIETRGRDAVLPRRSAALLYNLPDDGCEILMRSGSSVTFHP